MEIATRNKYEAGVYVHRCALYLKEWNIVLLTPDNTIEM